MAREPLPRKVAGKIRVLPGSAVQCGKASFAFSKMKSVRVVRYVYLVINYSSRWKSERLLFIYDGYIRVVRL